MSVVFDPILNRLVFVPSIVGSIYNDLNVLKNNDLKISYFLQIDSVNNTVSIPEGSNIMLGQFDEGVDAYLSSIVKDKPNGEFPVDVNGLKVDVLTFDADGNYTLTGVPVNFPVIIIFSIKIKYKDLQNVPIGNIIDLNNIASDSSAIESVWGEITGNLSDQTDLQTVLDEKELLANKVTDFSTINNDLYPTVEAANNADQIILSTAEAYTDSHVLGLWDDRGNYNPTATSTYPVSGGSGTAGAILKGDIWTINGLGVGITHAIGTKVVQDGDTVRSLIDTPSTTDANWAIAENNIGYVPENVANKEIGSSLTDDTTKYPSSHTVLTSQTAADAVVLSTAESYADGKVIDSIADSDTTHAPSRNAVFDALALKVDKNSPVATATKTKITYDIKGLVTNGADATTADINDSTNRRYVTDAQSTVIGNTSGTNTGDQTVASLGLSTAASLNQGCLKLSVTGNGGVILTGQYGMIASLPVGGTITHWYVIGKEASGSIQFDLKRWNGASYVSIVGSGNKPAITTAQRANAAQNGSWTSITLSVLDEFIWNVDSCTTFTEADVMIYYTKT